MKRLLYQCTYTLIYVVYAMPVVLGWMVITAVQERARNWRG